MGFRIRLHRDPSSYGPFYVVAESRGQAAYFLLISLNYLTEGWKFNHIISNVRCPHYDGRTIGIYEQEIYQKGRILLST